MNIHPSGDKSPNDLRMQAEIRLSQRISERVIRESDPLKLIHELEVHQIELEIQNEELQLARETSEILLNKYSDIYDNAPTGYLTLDSNGKILQLNRKAIHDLGSDKTKILGRPFQSFLVDSDFAMFNLFLANTMKDKGVHDCEVTLQVKGLGPQIVEIKGSPSDDHKECRIILIDVTERREIEGSLKILKLALDACANAVILTDPNGTIEWSNPAFSALTGYSIDEVTGANMRLVKSGKQDNQFYQHMWSTILSKSVWRGEIVNRRKDGSTYTVSASITPVLSETGEITHFIATKEDISDRKHWESEIQSMNRDLEYRVEQRTSDLLQAKAEADHANLAKSQFLSRVSHELRTPMNAILGFAQVLDARVQDAQTKKDLGMILKGGHHLMTLINELLDLARLESGKEDFHIASVLVSDVIDQSVELLKPIANHAEVEVLIEQASLQGMVVRADRQWLTQVMLNLLSNAIKYNRQRGVVRIKGEQLSNGMSLIEVSDTGLGFTATDREKIFQPFTRFSNLQVEGSGLGLSLSKSYMDLMGGSIKLSDTSPAGSVFQIEIRTATSEEYATSQGVTEPCVPDVAPKQALILYVEDDASNVAVMQEILKLATKHRLLYASTGKEGLQMAITNLPDLILLDNGLPDTSGKGVLASLKANIATQSIPVIMFSGDAMPTTIQELKDAGAVDYLTKPVDMRQLIRTINEQLAIGSRNA